MENLSAWTLEVMDRLGLLGVVFMMFLENVFPPIPSEIIMSLAGFWAAQGRAPLLLVILAGTLGSVLGALPLYYLGAVFDKDRLLPWVEKYGKYALLTPADVENAQAWFDKYGKAAVFFGRMIPAVRSLISVPAGMSRMPLAPFLLLTAVGSCIWTTILAYAGFALGVNYQKIEVYIEPVSKGVVALVLLVAIALAARRVYAVFFGKSP